MKMGKELEISLERGCFDLICRFLGGKWRACRLVIDLKER